jgi:hypothetical protein
LASVEFVYCPMILPFARLTLRWWRAHDDTFARTPFSTAPLPRYAPHFHATTNVRIGLSGAYTPIAPSPTYTSGRMYPSSSPFATSICTHASWICSREKRGSVMMSLHESNSRSMCSFSRKMVVEPSARLYARMPSNAPSP